MYTEEERAEIWLDSFGAEYNKKMCLAEQANTPRQLAALFSARFAEAEALVGEKTAAKMKKSLCGGYFAALLQKYEQKGIACVSYSSPLYPEDLRQLPDPPLVLYCKGNAELLAERKFAVVGSRHTPPQIMKITERYAAELSKHFVIVTGMADGGDSAALLGALPSGKVISVLAYGFDFVYPECNRALLEKTAKEGLLVSEYTPEVKPRGYLFPARNRVIAGLCDGVLVVSGGEKSGTRITADLAMSYGRDVFAFPYSVGASAGAGCNALIKEYAKLTDNLVDITAAFGINLTETEEISLTEAERAVYEVVRQGETHLMQISEKTGLKPYELSPVLTLLEMKNLVVSCGGNRYAAIR